MARTTGSPARHGADKRQFRLMFLASFVLFLIAAAVSRLVPRRTGAPARVSIFRQARTDAYATIPFAFM